jgi:L-aminopeptidase/D-esterase-like protein
MRNDITDIEGLAVGQAEDAGAKTGVTVVLCDAPAIAAVDVRGGGPGTRETEVLNPAGLIRTVDAIVLSGGSVYGLGAGDAVCAALGAQGRGYALMERPGVPASTQPASRSTSSARWG